MTYLDHFKLLEAPFRLTPDPDFVYLSEQHARAKSYMGSTIWLDDGFVMITGEVGSGKTTILQSFIGELDETVTCAVVSQTQLTPTEFLEAALYEFGLKPFGKSKVELMSMMAEFLIEQYAEGKKVLLIVDEAQNLTWKVLEEIRLLSGIESHKDKVLRIILSGQPELKKVLETPQLKQLMQRVRCKLHLGPLTEKETQAYILHRLDVAGNKNKALVRKDCYPDIFRYSGGVPRLINTLCDTAFLCAFADDRKIITRDDVMSAIEELGWREPANNQEEDGVPFIARLGSTPLASDSLVRIDVRHKGQFIAEHYFPAGTITIGRATHNSICLSSKFVSVDHAEIVCDPAGSTIRDLNSTNGVFVRGDRVTEYRLKNRDTVAIDAFELGFTDLAAEGERAPGEEQVDGGQRDEGEDSAIREYTA